MSDTYPNDLLYTEDHEWARPEGNLVTVGISQFAVEQLGDVTQVDLPREGEFLIHLWHRCPPSFTTPRSVE